MQDDNQAPQDKNRIVSDADLEARRQALQGKIDVAHAVEAQHEAPQPRSVADASGFAQAIRLSSEFVAGVFVGGAIGWAIDYVAGSKPWGLIVFTLLGFVAGMLNMMRATGAMPAFGKNSGKMK